MRPAAHAEKILGPLEAAVMRVVWGADHPVSVREVFKGLNRRRSQPLAYTTVMTVMARLAEKDILSRRLVGRSYQYEALVPDAAAIAVRALLRDFGLAAVNHFVNEARADPKLLSRLQELLARERQP